jgi:ABC-type sugar transport system permease subunit
MTATTASSMSDGFETTTVAKHQRDPILIALWIALLVVALIWLAPFVFIVFTSLKTQADVTTTGAFMPPLNPAFGNYSNAWGRGNFASAFLNSAIITVIKVPLGLILSAMAAYALAKIRLRFGKALLLLVIFGTMIPFQVMLAPLFTLVNSLGLIDTYPGVILPYIAFGVPEPVVNGFEVVEVEEHHGCRLADASAQVQRLLGDMVEAAPVGDARQFIHRRQVEGHHLAHDDIGKIPETFSVFLAEHSRLAVHQA